MGFWGAVTKIVEKEKLEKIDELEQELKQLTGIDYARIRQDLEMEKNLEKQQELEKQKNIRAEKNQKSKEILESEKEKLSQQIKDNIWL